MVDPKQREQEKEASDREPELEAETVKDLAAPEADADEVRGGVAPRAPECYCGSM